MKGIYRFVYRRAGTTLLRAAAFNPVTLGGGLFFMSQTRVADDSTGPGSPYAIAEAKKRRKTVTDNRTFDSRTHAFNAAKDRAGIPRSQQPNTQYEVGDNFNRSSHANYRFSAENTSGYGRVYVYDTPYGPRAIAEHINDGPPHFHAGQPGDPETFKSFKDEFYVQVDGHHHFWYRK